MKYDPQTALALEHDRIFEWEYREFRQLLVVAQEQVVALARHHRHNLLDERVVFSILSQVGGQDSS